MKKNIKYLLFYLVLAALLVFAVAQLFRTVNTSAEKMTYGKVAEYFKEDRVKTFTVNASNGTLKLEIYPLAEDGTVNLSGKVKSETYTLASYSQFYNDFHEYYLNNQNLEATYEFRQDNSSIWQFLLPILLVVGVVVLFFVFFGRSQKNGSGHNPGGMGMGMGGFGRARVKTPSADKNPVRFSDVAGADEEKQELEEIVEFLKAPAKFSKLGARIPHGVLLVGPPGTGKTLLAKAVAGEAGVPFFSISGSDFVEMYVGVGASRVRDLFETARKAPASIIFIDEIDAVGRHRGAGLGGGHDEREQTLNQLLVEMDGFGSHEGIIVMAATNRPDILDPALLRPGRFDRQVTVNIPDIHGREEILKVHARNKPLEPGVDLAEIARTTAGFTGADLANLLNEAALLAARRSKTLIGMDDISDAFIKIIAGPKKKSRHIKDEDKRKTAYHEAGHAMVSYLLGLDPVQQISIIPSGNALGYTLNPPAEDKYSVYKDELKNEISMLLAGRAAEEIIYGSNVSGGASNDIERATKKARNMVMKLGMSDVLGPINYGGEQGEVFLGRDFNNAQDFSDATAAKIDQEVFHIISSSYQKALELLRANLEKMHFFADFLVKNEVMDGDQFRAAMERETVTIEEIEEIAAEKRRRSDEANRERARQAANEAAQAAAEESSSEPAGDAESPAGETSEEETPGDGE